MVIALDACCGFKNMWKGKDTSNVIFLDKRREVKPTILADARWLPFRDKVFDIIYCDPPHLIRSDAKSILTRSPKSVGAKYLRKFGWFNSRSEWIVFLYRVNREFKRCLKDDGKLWFKLVDGKDRRVTKLRDVEIYLDNFQITSKKVADAKAGWSTNKTIYLWMKKA